MSIAEFTPYLIVLLVIVWPISGSCDPGEVMREDKKPESHKPTTF